MNIQCPKCDARYRTRILVQAHSPLQVTCPNCSYRFIVAAAQTDGSNNDSILIVDDARFFRELILDLLAPRAASLTTANSAGDAWNRLQRTHFDLLIIDVNLPDASGLDLIRKIRADKRFERIPVLCISGVYHRDDDARLARAAGADDFMTKSFYPEDFLSRIDRLLAR